MYILHINNANQINSMEVFMPATDVTMNLSTEAVYNLSNGT